MEAENYEKMDIKSLKELASKRNLQFAKNAGKDAVIKLLKEQDESDSEAKCAPGLVAEEPEFDVDEEGSEDEIESNEPASEEEKPKVKVGYHPVTKEPVYV